MKDKDTVSPKPDSEKEVDFWIGWLSKRIDLAPIQREYIAFCLSELQQENKSLASRLSAANEYLKRNGNDVEF